MSTATQQFTANQLLKLPRGKARYELLRGELRTMSPSGSEHSVVTARLALRVGQFVNDRQLGLVFGAEGGFLIEQKPDTVLAPDLAFVRRERVPASGPPPEFWPGAPDLAVEVASPGDSTREINEKAAAWLRAGTQLAWVVNPRRRTVTVCLPDGKKRSLTANEHLDGGDVLPGFTCRVADLFWQG